MLDGERMKFFGKSTVRRNERTVEQGMLGYILKYAQELELPEPSEEIVVRLFHEGMTNGGGRCRFSVRASHYLLVYTSEGEDGWLNAGYVLERTAVFLQEHKIDGKILQQVPDALAPLPDGKRVSAVLAFGIERGRRRQNEEAEHREQHPLICHEAGEHWTEEVLELASEFLTPDMQTGVRVIRKGQVIHLATGRFFGRSAENSKFHAGMILAAIMEAAQERWIDVSMVRIRPEAQRQAAGPDYVISVCRAQDRVLCEMAETSAAFTEEGRNGLRRGGHQWKYA